MANNVKQPTVSQRMEQMFRRGMTYNEIGASFGLSRQAVHLRLKKIGISSGDGGAALRHLVTDERRRQKFTVRYGCTKEQRGAFASMGITAAYTQQRNNARTRGIAWRLSLGEFAALWILSGAWPKRGVFDGEFVMARFLDRGPYSWSNVEILTANENSYLSRLR